MRRSEWWMVVVALAATTILLVGCGDAKVLLEMRAGSLAIGLLQSGYVAGFRDTSRGVEHMPEGMTAPLLQLRVAGRDLGPELAVFDPADSTLTLGYEGGLNAAVRVRQRPTHVRLELEAVSEPERVELAIWGPFPTTIRETIGETVGVVRGEGYAIGLQALNPKTLGGFPWNENDAMPQLDIFESGDFSDLSEEGKRHVLYRVEAAKPDSFGSTLQAYTRSRRQERVIQNWGHERYVAPPFDDGGVVGSAIALFGSPEEESLATIGAIEVAEGLPHPTIDGEWGKMARSAAAAYVILPFGEATLDQALDVTLKAGLRYLYHPGPFATWGHFPLNDDFPRGVPGLRMAVERAEERGVMLGVHTLSNFVTTDDTYVTPVPDPRLARVGGTILEEDVPVGATEITLRSPEFFNQHDNDNLRAAVMGNEIIRYRTVSDASPWRLLDVQRGAFGTESAFHSAGESISKLADHAYRVFLTDPDLSTEMARNIADLFNRTGLRQISFDGLEGNRSTGMGNYGEILFTSTWYDALNPEIRAHFIADASRTSHFFWHIYSRMNWGEPWYAGFRESQTEYRLKNQAYFRRNLMPGMLGWFQMRPETSVEDIEWMLARSAAFDAGYAFVTSFDALEENGRSEEILALLGRWEAARMADAFSVEQKRRMENIANEFNLEQAEDGGWMLRQIHVSRHLYEGRARQPGEPSHRTFAFGNPVDPQPLGFILTAQGGSVEGIRLEVDGVSAVEIPGRLQDGDAVVYAGGGEAVLYSAQWKALGTFPLDSGALGVASGLHELVVDAQVSGDGEANLKVELRLRGPGEPLSRD